MGGIQFGNYTPDKNKFIVNQLPGNNIPSVMGKSLLSRERGQELVEFAIVLPLLLIVFIGVMDLGRVFHASITVANSSRAGARYAVSRPGYTDNGSTVDPKDIEIKARITQEAANSGITVEPLLIDIVCSPNSCPKGTGSVIVTVDYNFPFLFNSIIGTGIDMTHSTEMKIPW